MLVTSLRNDLQHYAAPKSGLLLTHGTHGSQTKQRDIFWMWDVGRFHQLC
jgi:hypothetical protein